MIGEFDVINIDIEEHNHEFENGRVHSNTYWQFAHEFEHGNHDYDSDVNRRRTVEQQILC